MFSLNLNRVNLKQSAVPYLLILLAGSLWAIYYQHGELNDDGGLYVRQGYFFAHGDFQSGFAIFPWPLFGLLIGVVHAVTKLPLILSAHLVDVSCFLIATLFYFKTLRLVAKSPNILLAGFLVLLTAIPLMDDYLPMVLRDHGMWMGFMAGVYFFLRWQQSGGIKIGALWQASFILGGLFRPEVLILNLLLPIYGAFNPPKSLSPWRTLLESLSLVIVAAFGLLTLILIKGGNNINFGRLPELINRPLAFFHEIFSPMPVTTDNIYLKSAMSHFPLVHKISFICTLATYKMLVGIGALAAVTTFYAIQKKLINKSHLKVLKVLFSITFIVSLANLLLTYVDSSRYWMMNYWLIYLVAAVGLSDFLSGFKTIKQISKWFWMLLLCLVIITQLWTILFDSKPHRPIEHDVVTWMKDHNINPRQVFMNDRLLIIHAERYDLIQDGEVISEKSLKDFAYVALRSSEFEANRSLLAPFQILATIKDGDTPRFVILQRR
jgi:hypothetical protein